MIYLFISTIQCDFRTARIDTLRQHIAAKHDGVRWPCDQCGFSASFKAR